VVIGTRAEDLDLGRVRFVLGGGAVERRARFAPFPVPPPRRRQRRAARVAPGARAWGVWTPA